MSDDMKPILNKVADGTPIICGRSRNGIWYHHVW